jgi:hypothetical protein
MKPTTYDKGTAQVDATRKPVPAVGAEFDITGSGFRGRITKVEAYPKPFSYFGRTATHHIEFDVIDVSGSPHG